MRLVLLGFVVYLCRRLGHELKKTVNQYDAEAEKAKHQKAKGRQATGET